MVVEVLGAGAVVADVVRAPSGAEGVTAGAQLADQVVQVLIVRVAVASARTIATVMSAKASQSG